MHTTYSDPERDPGGDNHSRVNIRTRRTRTFFRGNDGRFIDAVRCLSSRTTNTSSARNVERTTDGRRLRAFSARIRDGRTARRSGSEESGVEEWKRNGDTEESADRRSDYADVDFGSTTILAHSLFVNRFYCVNILYMCKLYC